MPARQAQTHDESTRTVRRERERESENERGTHSWVCCVYRIMGTTMIQSSGLYVYQLLDG